MSYQAVEWALYRSPMLLTAGKKPDTTARQVLAILAEHADEYGANARPSVLRIRWATGFDERTIQRALARMERANVIRRDGVGRDGVTRWRLALAMVRPESDWVEMEAQADEAKRVESERRAARRDRAASVMTGVDVSGTQNPGQHGDGSMCPGRRIPASGTQNAGVRDSASRRPGRSATRTTHEPPMNHQGTTLGGTLPPNPLRPPDPTPSNQGTEPNTSTSMRGDQPVEAVGDHRPRASTPPPAEHATPDQTHSPPGRPDPPPAPRGILGGPITTAAAADLKTRGQPVPRCEHGMHDVVRVADGRHCCPACRRGLPTDPTAPPATRLPPAAGPPPAAPGSPPDQPGDNVLPFRRPRTARHRKEPA